MHKPRARAFKVAVCAAQLTLMHCQDRKMEEKRFRNLCNRYDDSVGDDKVEPQAKMLFMRYYQYQSYSTMNIYVLKSLASKYI